MTGTYFSLARHCSPLQALQRQVRREIGQRVDWLRIYIVNEEEILLGGTCSSPTTRRRVAEAVRAAAPGARLRNAVIVGEMAPGLHPATTPRSTRRAGR